MFVQGVRNLQIVRGRQCRPVLRRVASQGVRSRQIPDGQSGDPVSAAVLFTRLGLMTEECEQNGDTRQVRKPYPDERLCSQVKRFPVS
ncbi:MAG: hypothetical protein A4C66_00960 [Nitrospira sp. HN-bin3]|nr:MAG: hypothetical protein A4C66_00960 [Nitrospira sp. HN-bin3]